MVTDKPSNQLVLEKHHGHGVVELTLNRPSVLNALNERLFYTVASLLRKHNSRPSTRLIVLTGAGTRSFCGGIDVKEVVEPGQARRTIRAARAMIEALMLCDTPVVAAVFGAVTGIGVTLLLHCDQVYAARDATFQTPFAAVGIAPEFGSSVLFPQLLGLRVAHDLLLRGRALPAAEMERVGALQVVHTVSRDDVVGAAVRGAVEWSLDLGEAEQWNGVVEAKRLVRAPIRRQVERAMKAEFVAIDKQISRGDTSKMMKKKVEEISKRNAKL